MCLGVGRAFSPTDGCDPSRGSEPLLYYQKIMDCRITVEKSVGVWTDKDVLAEVWKAERLAA